MKLPVFSRITKTIKVTLVSILSLHLVMNPFFSTQALAGSTSDGGGAPTGTRSSDGLSLSQDIMPAGLGNEFISGNYPGAILMNVNLWGAIGKPGIHHVPTQTDLVTLLSLAGGPLVDAQLDHIVIKRRSASGDQVIKVDGDDLLMNASTKSPILEPNDIVIIPREKPPISSNLMTTVSFAAGVMGLILGAVALSVQFKGQR